MQESLPFDGKLLQSDNRAWCKQDEVRLVSPSWGVSNSKLGTCKTNGTSITVKMQNWTILLWISPQKLFLSKWKKYDSDLSDFIEKLTKNSIWLHSLPNLSKARLMQRNTLAHKSGNLTEACVCFHDYSGRSMCWK